MGNLKKQVANAAFFIAVFLITLYTIFNDKDVGQIVSLIGQAKKQYIMLIIIIIPVFVCCESVIIHMMMKRLGKRVPFRRCCQYSFIGFFVGCITPSASGGQPAQVYYMKKDKIDISLSTFVLIIVTAVYKIVLIIIGVLTFVFAKGWLEDAMDEYMWLFYVGMLLNIVFVSIMIFVAFSKRILIKITDGIYNFLKKLKLLKHTEEKYARLKNSVKNYNGAADMILNNKSLLVPIFAITAFQRLLIFFVTYLVYLALGLSGTSMILIVMLQAIISVTVDMLPLPGGMGISENLFLYMFRDIFGASMVLPGVLLSRGTSFYLLLIISGMVTMWVHIRIKRTRDKKC